VYHSTGREARLDLPVLVLPVYHSTGREARLDLPVL
jgi:hypothetical protein